MITIMILGFSAYWMRTIQFVIKCSHSLDHKRRFAHRHDLLLAIRMLYLALTDHIVLFQALQRKCFATLRTLRQLNAPKTTDAQGSNDLQFFQPQMRIGGIQSNHRPNRCRITVCHFGVLQLGHETQIFVESTVERIV